MPKSHFINTAQIIFIILYYLTIKWSKSHFNQNQIEINWEYKIISLPCLEWKLVNHLWFLSIYLTIKALSNWLINVRCFCDFFFKNNPFFKIIPQNTTFKIKYQNTLFFNLGGKSALRVSTSHLYFFFRFK